MWQHSTEGRLTTPWVSLERMDVYLALRIVDALRWFAASIALAAFRQDLELNGLSGPQSCSTA